MMRLQSSIRSVILGWTQLSFDCRKACSGNTPWRDHHATKSSQWFSYDVANTNHRQSVDNTSRRHSTPESLFTTLLMKSASSICMYISRGHYRWWCSAGICSKPLTICYWTKWCYEFCIAMSWRYGYYSWLIRWRHILWKQHSTIIDFKNVQVSVFFSKHRIKLLTLYDLHSHTKSFANRSVPWIGTWGTETKIRQTSWWVLGWPWAWKKKAITISGWGYVCPPQLSEDFFNVAYHYYFRQQTSFLTTRTASTDQTWVKPWLKSGMIQLCNEGFWLPTWWIVRRYHKSTSSKCSRYWWLGSEVTPGPPLLWLHCIFLWRNENQQRSSAHFERRLSFLAQQYLISLQP